MKQVILLNKQRIIFKYRFLGYFLITVKFYKLSLEFSIIYFMSYKILAFAAVIAIATLFVFKYEGHKDVHQFEKFKYQHDKVYSSTQQEQYRKSIFYINLAHIQAFNALPNKSYKKGINQFTDLTKEEFINTYLGTTINDKFTTLQTGRTMMPGQNLGDIDWSAKGKVSPIKDQGNCGSCWAFSTTGAIQSSLLVSSSRAVDLSEQQLVDCSGSYGNQGCNGGWMDSAFSYIRDHGISTETEYPYMAKTQSCKKNEGPLKIKGFVDVSSCNNLENALTRQPISVAVDATQWSSYSQGILDDCGTVVNHGVLVVGKTDKYWKIKNSWSAGWGESGYIRIAPGNTCAVCNYPSYPTLL